VSRARSGAAAVAIVLALAPGVAAAAAPVGDGAALLPASGALPGLVAEGAPLRLRGAELYGHIDGGAEPFLELGFDHLVAQEYRSRGGAVAVEVYVMDDPTAALGIYLMKCGREPRLDGLAARHSAAAGQVMLVGGNVFANVYDAVGDGRADAAVAAAAGAVSARLPAAVEPPELALLPAEGRVEGSLRVLRGAFTLQRVFTFGEGDVLGLSHGVTAVAADFADGRGGTTTRLAAVYPTDEAARAALATLAASLDPGLVVRERSAERLELIDWSGRLGVVEVRGASLTAHLNQPSGREGGASPPALSSPL